MRERQPDLFAFHFSGVQDVDLRRRLERAARDDTLWTDGTFGAASPDAECEGVVLGLRRIDGNTYLLYGYRFDDVEYGFAWRPRTEDADASWLERLTEGLEFSVALRASAPAVHAVTDPRFAMLTGPVLALGTFSRNRP